LFACGKSFQKTIFSPKNSGISQKIIIKNAESQVSDFRSLLLDLKTRDATNNDKGLVEQTPDLFCQYTT